MLVELEVENQNPHGSNKCQHNTSQDDENILRDEGPWGMACSEEGRLLYHQLGHTKLQNVVGKTYMVLHHIWAGKAIGVLEKRC
jgi:hypothetical protein